MTKLVLRMAKQANVTTLTEEHPLTSDDVALHIHRASATGRLEELIQTAETQLESRCTPARAYEIATLLTASASVGAAAEVFLQLPGIVAERTFKLLYREKRLAYSLAEIWVVSREVLNDLYTALEHVRKMTLTKTGTTQPTLMETTT